MSEMGEEAVLLDMRTGEYFLLNEVGSRAWKALSEGGEVDDALRAILDEYEAPEQQVSHDLDGFLSDLVARGLAEPAGGSGPER